MHEDETNVLQRQEVSCVETNQLWCTE